LPKGTIDRIVYDAERAQTFLDATFILESSLKDIQDELLHAILMPKDKKAFSLGIMKVNLLRWMMENL